MTDLHYRAFLKPFHKNTQAVFLTEEEFDD